MLLRKWREVRVGRYRYDYGVPSSAKQGGLVWTSRLLEDSTSAGARLIESSDVDPHELAFSLGQVSVPAEGVVAVGFFDPMTSGFRAVVGGSIYLFTSFPTS